MPHSLKQSAICDMKDEMCNMEINIMCLLEKSHVLSWMLPDGCALRLHSNLYACVYPVYSAVFVLVSEFILFT